LSPDIFLHAVHQSSGNSLIGCLGIAFSSDLELIPGVGVQVIEYDKDKKRIVPGQMIRSQSSLDAIQDLMMSSGLKKGNKGGGLDIPNQVDLQVDMLPLKPSSIPAENAEQ